LTAAEKERKGREKEIKSIALTAEKERKGREKK
jgi:hypothetical protein